MGERNRAQVSLHFADGSTIHEWSAFSLRDTYDDPVGSLSFELPALRSRIEELRTRLAKGQLVTLKINGVSQGGFLIQTSTITVDPAGGVVFSLECKSPLVTVQQGSINPDLAIKPGVDAPVGGMVIDALAPMLGDGIAVAEDSSANADVLTGKRRDKKAPAIPIDEIKGRDAAAHPNETAYGFVARFITRLGVCLRMAADGTLLVGAPDYEQAAVAAVHQTFGRAVSGSDPFMSVTVRSTNDNQFSECVVIGQSLDDAGQTQSTRPVARVVGEDSEALRPAGAPFAKATVATLPDGLHSYSSEAAAYKPLIRKDKNARDTARATSIAKFAMGMRAKDAFVVTGVVDGMISATGVVWSVDTVVRVTVDAAGLDADMWVLSRTFTLRPGEGQRTELTLIPLGALTLGDLPQ